MRLRRPAVAALLLLTFFGCSSPDSASFVRKPAEVMSHRRALWLEREDRAEEERPDLVIDALGLEDGDVVADIGCGTGYFTRRLAKAVSPSGSVYAVDIQQEMLDMMEESLRNERLENVVSVLGTDDDPRLPAGAFDWVVLVDVYHEFQRPEQMLARIRESLSAGGRVALVEYRLEGDSASHIWFEHRMSAEQVLAEWIPAGFELVERVDTLPTQHMFVFESGVGR